MIDNEGGQRMLEIGTNMFTDPSYRRMGIAKELLSRLCVRQENTDAGLYRSPHPIWEYFYILISGS